MTDTSSNYYDLNIEDSWMEYLRTRLPYSFNHIEKKGRGRSTHFVLSEPVLLTGREPAEHHNFWKRGNVYYMTGKLMDYYSMSQVGWLYRLLEAERLLTHGARVRLPWPTDAFTFYNSLQMEKVWSFAQDNNLDRERVMMTNIILSAELCLKATMTHATYSEKGRFEFGAGHNIGKLFEDLPPSLQDAIEVESKVFAKEYLGFRARVEEEIRGILDRRLSPPESGPIAKREAEEEWNRIAERIGQSSYTAFVNSNDPGKRKEQLHEDWFKEALEGIAMVEDFHDISQYFRYAPQKDKDDLPVDLITWVLLLGRFLYEHLFPVPSLGDAPRSGLPLRSG